jgi:hypothetical protein
VAVDKDVKGIYNVDKDKPLRLGGYNGPLQAKNFIENQTKKIENFRKSSELIS